MAIPDIETMDPNSVTLTRDEFCDLRLLLSDGSEYTGVSAYRAFPFAAPRRFIILADEGNKEIGVIDDLDALDRDSASVVAEELAKSYFIPRILRVNKIDEDFGVPNWDVETDRGHRWFQLKSRSDSRLVGAGRVLVTDIDGNRYEVPDYRTLDAKSQAFIEEEV